MPCTVQTRVRLSSSHRRALLPLTQLDPAKCQQELWEHTFSWSRARQYRKSGDLPSSLAASTAVLGSSSCGNTYSAPAQQPTALAYRGHDACGLLLYNLQQVLLPQEHHTRSLRPIGKTADRQQTFGGLAGDALQLVEGVHHDLGPPLEAAQHRISLLFIQLK